MIVLLCLVLFAPIRYRADLSYQGGKTIYIEEDFMSGFENCDAIEIFYHDSVMNHTGANVTKKVKSYFGNTINLKTHVI